MELDTIKGVVLVNGISVPSESNFAFEGIVHTFDLRGCEATITCKNSFGGDELKLAEEKEDENCRYSTDGKTVYSLVVGDKMLAPSPKHNKK